MDPLHAERVDEYFCSVYLAALFSAVNKAKDASAKLRFQLTNSFVNVGIVG